MRMISNLASFKSLINKSTSRLMTRNPSHVHSTLCVVKYSFADVSPKTSMNAVDRTESYTIKQYLGNNKEEHFTVKSKDVTKIYSNPLSRFVFYLLLIIMTSYLIK